MGQFALAYADQTTGVAYANPSALPAKIIVASLYAAFRILTGLRTRALPDHSLALTRAGFRLKDRKPFLSGLLVSELWTAADNMESMSQP